MAWPLRHGDVIGGFCVWGVERTLQATVGMFALALWDRHEEGSSCTRSRRRKAALLRVAKRMSSFLVPN